MGNLKSLQLLQIWDCPNLASLPEGLRCLASLERLIIGHCPILKQRCQEETGEDWSKIAHISRAIHTLKNMNTILIKGWVSGDWVPTKNSHGLIVIVQQQVTKKWAIEEFL
ncbi:PREDICTED: putative disease resistance protein RGA1 [Prunus mume]|uniref:Disease resistance protein RGA1 n=1 Tax=Prunus mume TaxID=102107 RepID=A0ABM1LRU9_PRUMU|nr:PREDICTED: putative disease resistance protein RGA1 [Prunus mume]